jgi:Ca2+-binding RTX toxin-like protein
MAIDVIIGNIDEDDDLKGGDGSDDISGLSGDDTLNGKGGEDFLNGGEDDDKLKGGGDDDELQGDNGRDVLDGGKGEDRLRGGDDNDTFKFGKDFGKDTILDFEGDADVIDLTAHDLKFDDLKIKYEDGDATISKIPGGKITLENVAIDSLGKSDFDF